MKYIIDGPPIPLARPRFYCGRAYDSQASEKNDCKLVLKLLHRQHVQLDGPIHLEVNFFMPIPKSWSAMKQKFMDGKFHTSKPDWSNLLKFIEDCATGICYRDDCLVASVAGTKVYDNNPRTELTLRTLTIHQIFRIAYNSCTNTPETDKCSGTCCTDPKEENIL